MKRRIGTILLVPWLLVGAAPALAVTDEEIFRDFRFNFINPGARSLGMGGAFISIADDATAAQANPAGLTNLFQPQFFSEIRFTRPQAVDTRRTVRDPFLPDEGFNVLVQTDPQQETSPSFVSYVHPLKKIWLGVSRHEVINTRNRTGNRYDFLFADGSDSRNGQGEIELRLTHFNVSVGWKANPRLRLGVTASYGQLDLNSRLVNTYTDPTGQVIGDPGLAGTQIEIYRTEADDGDDDLSWAAGLLWNVTDKVSAGLVLRTGGDYVVDQTLTGQPTDPALLPGQIAQRVFFNESGTLLTPENNVHRFANEFHIPDQLGLGLSYRPVAALTLALDAVSISYSDLLEGFDSRLNVLTFGFQEESEAAFRVDDQTNLHLGLEYLIQGEGGVVWALRGGAHQERSNRIRSAFEPGGFGLGSNDNFPPGRDVEHVSAGLGVVLNDRFQVDAALDVSDAGTEFVSSIIYSF